MEVKRTKCICGICTSRCIIEAESHDGRLAAIHPVTEAGYEGNCKLCLRGVRGADYAYRPDRILSPLRRTGERGSGEFQPISWDEAIAIISDKLLSLRTDHGADSVAFYSGYSKWYRPMLRRFAASFGSVNYGTESSACHRSAIMANMCNTGFKSAPDYERAGVMLSFARARLPKPAKEAHKRGMKIIVCDCRTSRDIEEYADLHLRPRPGTDAALAAGLARELFINGGADTEYMEKYVHGGDEYRAYVDAFTPEAVASLTGVPAEMLRRAAAMIRDFKPMCMFDGFTGAIHHRSGLQIFRAWEALSAVTGCYGRAGGNLPTGKLMPNGHAPYAYRELEFSHPREPGGRLIGGERFPLWAEMLDECQAMCFPDAIEKGELKAIFALGMNARMFPDSAGFMESLKKLDFFVDCDLWMSDAAKLADIVLPVCSSYERDQIALVNGGDKLWYSPAAIEPVGLSRSDEDIMIDLARAMELDDPLLTAGKEECRRWQLRGCGITLEQLMSGAAPHAMPSLAPAPKALEDGFATPSGRFELRSERLAAQGIEPLPRYTDPMAGQDTEAYPLTLMAGVRTDRYAHCIHSRTHTIPSFRARRPLACVDMNPTDAAALGLEKGDRVCLETAFGSIEVGLDFDADLLPGTVNMYQGYAEADVNTLIPGDWLDPITGFPGYKAIACRIRRP